MTLLELWQRTWPFGVDAFWAVAAVRAVCWVVERHPGLLLGSFVGAFGAGVGSLFVWKLLIVPMAKAIAGRP